MPFGHFPRAFPINGVVLVGVCAAGKSTVSQVLADYGIVAQSVAQEHSAVPTLFRRKGNHPVILLAADFATVRRRRRVSWTRQHYIQQWLSLRAAREAASLVVRTDPLSPARVAGVIVQWFDQRAGLDKLWASPACFCTEQDRAALRYRICCGGPDPLQIPDIADLQQARRQFAAFLPEPLPK